MTDRRDGPDREAPPEAPGAGGAETLGFGEAMGEIDAILRRIEAEKIDIDDLAEALRRASHLLEIGRAKIRRAEIEVTQIVQGLEGEGRAAPAAREEEPDDEDDGGDEPAGSLF